MKKSVWSITKTISQQLLVGIVMFVALIILAVAATPPRAGGIQGYPRQ